MPSELCFPTFQSADPVQLAAQSISNLNQNEENYEDEDQEENDEEENHIESNWQ